MLDERCDSCKGLLDPVVDVNRWRHHDCPPPPLPAAALAVLDRVARMGGRGGRTEPVEVEETKP